MNANYKNAAERALLAREIASEGIVLLKNEGEMLPFGTEKVAVFGRTQVDTVKCGTGSAFCESEYCISVLDGIMGAGISVDEVLAEKYRVWCAENTVATFGVWGSGAHISPEMPLCEEEISAAAERAEKAVFVIGRTAGENDDSAPVTGDFLLSPEEYGLLETIKKYFAKVAVIVNSGNLINLSFTECEEIRAVLLLNLPGMEGGRALGEILAGKVSPSGKLTDTIARNYEDYPASAYFGKKAGLIQNYYEDIFVGYRYFETFVDAGEKVLYHFGHGLSYTTFEKRLLSFECTGKCGEVSAKIAVKNTGAKYAGKETVMLYSSAPAAAGAPKYELRAFAKTRLLAPGEEEVLSLSFRTQEMASFDDKENDAWTLYAGKYTVYFGNRADELCEAGVWENGERTAVKKCAHIPTELENRLIASGEYEALDAVPPDITNGIHVGPTAAMKVRAEHYSEMCEETREIFAEYKKSTENIRTYRLNIITAGTYKMRLAAPEMPKVVYIGALPMAHFEDYFAADGAEVILPPGTVEFSFEGEGEKPLVSFDFEKVDETVHVKAQGSSLLECGKFTEAALYVIAREFVDEGGLIEYGRGLFRMHAPGRYAMYKLEVEKAGYYDFTIRYSTYHDTRDLAKTYSFMVSNVTQSIESVMLEKTTEEDAPFVFRTAAPIRLALPAGEAYLKVVSGTKHTPHLAYMEITPSTRKVVLTEEADGGAAEAENIAEESAELGTPESHRYPRKDLPEIKGKYDFRNVLAGKITLDEFVADLSDEELAALTCGNKNGQIGRMSSRGVPEAYWSDGSVGYRQNFTVTVFPSSTMVASTWNVDLAREFGRSIGVEGKLYNVDAWLAPAINIHRDPCCGRNFEYMSEDPYITGAIASAIVTGVQESAVGATVKHFAANSTEYQRMKSNSRISARALREIYMKAFEIVIERANPYSIMTSYNLINGVKVSENPLFTADIMRGDFGYDGLLMSDYGNDSVHTKELIAKQDLKMQFGDPRTVVKDMKEGTLPRENVRGCVKKVLEFIMKTACVNSEVK